jgi:hypothetical protein
LSEPAAEQATHPDSSLPPSDEDVGFGDPYTRYVMLMLFLVYVMSYVDQQLASVGDRAFKLCSGSTSE